MNHSDHAYRIALSSLPGITPNRLRRVCAHRSLAEAWAAVSRGVPLGGEGPDRIDAGLAATWKSHANAFDFDAAVLAHAQAGIEVLDVGHRAFAGVFDHDPCPPSTLFAKGSLAAIEGARVAVIGTRDCTHYGTDLATRFGRELSEAGVSVVSGLALGIDGFAHKGALEVTDGAPPIGVVGSGIGHVYPPQHCRLWNDVAERGVLLSEYPVHTRPSRWSFPARNRLIAALADVVVVVESHATGGSLTTVDEASSRGVDVLAVPGSVGSPASDGTNRLLFDGCGVVRCTDDILLRLGQVARVAIDVQHQRRVRNTRPEPGGDAAILLKALSWESSSIDQLVVRTGLPVGQVAMIADQLETDGWISVVGGWFQRIDAGGKR